jgi:hypothetical protein
VTRTYINAASLIARLGSSLVVWCRGCKLTVTDVQQTINGQLPLALQTPLNNVTPAGQELRRSGRRCTRNVTLRGAVVEAGVNIPAEEVRLSLHQRTGATDTLFTTRS